MTVSKFIFLQLNTSLDSETSSHQHKQDKDSSALNFDCSEASLDTLENSNFLQPNDKNGDSLDDMEITGKIDHNKTKVVKECMEMDK